VWRAYDVHCSDWVSDLYESYVDDLIPPPPLPPLLEFADQSSPPIPAPTTAKAAVDKSLGDGAVVAPPLKVCAACA
jgi:hypothetical protein